MEQEEFNIKILNETVYPSDERTISVVNDDSYGGAHDYIFRNCLGFCDGAPKYVGSTQMIEFIKRFDNGNVREGLQSEQVVLCLIDRHKKLNARFPSEQNEKAIKGLEMFLEAQRERVQDRIDRGVMGELRA